MDNPNKPKRPHVDTEMTETYTGKIVTPKSAPEESIDSGELKRPRRRTRTKKILAISLAVAIPVLSFAAAALHYSNGGLRDVPRAEREVFSVEESFAVCEQFQDFDCKVEFKPSDTIPAGKIMSQTPDSGFSFAAVKNVKVVYSSGPTDPVLPDLHKLSVTDAESALFAAGLLLGEVTEIDDRSVSPGRVVGAKDAPEELKNGDEIDLEIASETIEVPDWVGQTKAQIEVEADKLGVSVRFESKENEGAPDIALSQSPEAGARTKSNELIVTLSKPVKIVEIKVPEIVGMDELKAKSALATAGFTKITIVEVESTKIKERQVSQVVPAAGQTAKSDASIVVIVANPVK